MKKIISYAMLVAFTFPAFAQPSSLGEQVLFTVADDTILASEYMAVYNKNRNLGEDIDPKTPKEYLDLYVNFKLKVHEAKEMGMDTMPTFLREYSSYRDQLAAPYLSDKGVTSELILEAYERSKIDVRASHIMLKLAPAPLPEDTLTAYNSIMKIKAQLQKGGSFESMAKEYSVDTYSAANGGDLGYFTVFNMVYPFESAAYNADIGEVVGPIRTRFGYHLIKTTDKRPSRGTVQVAHILVLENEKTEAEKKGQAEKKINEIYAKLQQGEDFSTLAKQYSEDHTSAQKGGELYPFGINKMYPEFEDVAFGLKNPGDYSKPVKTPIGWHVIKLIKKDSVQSFEEMEPSLKEKVDRDDRSLQSQMSVLRRVKKDYSYREYPKTKELAFDQVGDELLKGKYTTSKMKYGTKTLFEFADQKYTVADFLKYVEENQRGIDVKSVYSGLSVMYKTYTEDEIINYEKTQLVNKYPEFRLLSREYFEGILLFDLTEQKVWRKSVVDTTGLEAYYVEHQDDYMWKERYDAYIIDASTSKIAKKAVKMLKKGSTKNEIETALNADSQLNVKIDSAVYEEGSKEILNEIEKELAASEILEKEGRYFVVVINEIIPPVHKTFKESRGLIISDYQNYLEQKWLQELKAAYPVKMNQEVLEKVVAELEAGS